MKELIQQMSTFELGLNVTVTGIVLVFAMLILLVGILVLFGKVIQAIQGISDRKAEKAHKAMLEAMSTDNAVTEDNSSADSVVNSSAAVSDEVVAVISAAVSAMYMGSNKKPVIKAISTSSRRRSAWANAGISDNTRAF